jgi:hypothetical protein
MIQADMAKNTLYLILDGFFGEAEIDAALLKTKQEIKKLKAGFSVINDVTGFKPTTSKAGDAIKATQAELVKLGMKHVIRVVGNNTIGAATFDRRGKEVGYNGNLEVETAPSVKEAEKLIRGLPRG